MLAKVRNNSRKKSVFSLFIPSKIVFLHLLPLSPLRDASHFGLILRYFSHLVVPAAGAGAPAIFYAG